MEKKQTRPYLIGAPGLLKVVMYMKLSIVFLLLTSLQLSANVFSQNTITLKLQSADLKKALVLIEKKSSFRFLYNDEVISSKEKVNIDANNTPVTEVLDNIFSGTALTYRVLNNNLVVVTKKDVVVQDVRVTGKVTGASGEALSQVSVNVKGSTAGTITGSDGTYSLSVPDGATLVFSSVGYESQEAVVGGRTEINISLKGSTKILDQVVVVGYGSQRKIDVTGSVANVKGEEISKQPVTNAVSGLQGKVAGVQITNNGGPGSSPIIRIRGIGSVSGSTSPLFVVDGVWFDDISFLSPSDIENITILKDASSEAIYGIRAANGVVLVTTKKGKSGRPVVTYNGSVGYQKVTNQIDMANAAEYTTLINEKAGTQVLDPAKYNVDGTDWYHQILRNALITNHSVGVSGGTDKTTYNLSFGYLDQDGLVKTNNYQRYTLHFQNDFQVAKPLKVGYLLNGVYSTSQDIDGGIFRQLYTAYPILPVRYEDGSYGDAGDFPLGDGAKYNPQVTIDYFNQRSKNYRFIGSAFAELTVAKHFLLRSSIGGERSDAYSNNYRPVYDLGPSMKNDHSNLTKTESGTRNWILENTLTYDTKINDHTIKVLLGQGSQSNRYTPFTVSALDVPAAANLQYIYAGDINTFTFDDRGAQYSTISSYFARVNYAYQNKYLLTASLRNDRSSKYRNDAGTFPSVGLGWVISKEKFMQNQKIFNNLKLRGSWGKVGNVSVPSNTAVRLINTDPSLTGVFGNPTVIVPGASEDRVTPPSTVWEKSVGTDVAIEATLLNNKLNVEAGYYVRKTENAIFPIPLLGSIGSSGAITGNQASFENKGWEFLVTYNTNITKDLGFSISANLGINQNKVLSTVSGSNPLDGGGNGLANGSLATRTVLGQPIGQFYGYQVAGVFQTDAEALPWGSKAGDFRFTDFSGPKGTPDGVIDGFDKIFLGNPNPKYAYGINTSWNFKQFDLALDFQGVAGVKIYNANVGWRYGNENFSKDFYDHRWHGEGTSNTYPSANIGNSHNAAPSSFFVESGSYFRVRNLQLGYTIASSISTKWHISKMRAFVNAQNPFNAFKYKGFSPEVGGGALDAGIDANVYPLYATYNFGVNVTF